MLHWLLRMARMVLQQVTHNMDLVLWSGKSYGSSRSIVRKIGSNLAIIQSPRVHLQLVPYPVALNGSKPNGAVASFADVGWVADEAGEAFARFRTQNHLHPNLSLEDNVSHFDRPLRRPVSLPVLLKEEPEVKPQPAANEEALQKISALECELANLRAQIAKIVTIQGQQNVAAVTSPTTPLVPGASPVSAPPAPPLPPPAPPLPPPLPPPALHRSVSAIDLIKQRKGKSSSDVIDRAPKKPEIPNMLDVLKDMSRVQLRSVKRTKEPKPSDPADPAALIAEALKKKFAYRYRSDSYGESDKSLPNVEHKKVTETPLFGPHMLKATGKMKSFIQSSNL
ncbi:mitochondrial fission regulator 1 [Rhinoderma darwinii]|uniref:mitochondrial fission regulator 1 n=1 Tax=Rhinoderma darwinii TaxID=43563 RepID=UPI003F6650F3